MNLAAILLIIQTFLRRCSVVGYFPTYRGDRVAFKFKVKHYKNSPISYIILRSLTSLAMLDSEPRPFETSANTRRSTKESHLGRLVSSYWSQSNIKRNYYYYYHHHHHHHNHNHHHLSGSAAQRGLWPPRFMRFLDHTQRRVTVGMTPLDK
jgi:hypothetical protein